MKKFVICVISERIVLSFMMPCLLCVSGLRRDQSDEWQLKLSVSSTVN